MVFILLEVDILCDKKQLFLFAEIVDLYSFVVLG